MASASFLSTQPYTTFLITHDVQKLEAEADELRDMTNIVGKIKGYALPEKPSCMDVIKHIAYRIWNAFKAIFCMSDWQQARRCAIHLNEKNGLSPKQAEEKADIMLDKYLQDNPQNEYQQFRIKMKFMDIVLRANKAANVDELIALGEDPNVVNFLSSQEFNSLIDSREKRESFSQVVFEDSERITTLLQALPLRV